MDDIELVRRFETCELPTSEFHHREHLGVAFSILRTTGDFGAAAIRFRDSLRRFAEAHRATGLYHETLTWAYLALVHERMAIAEHTTSEELLAAHPELLDHRGGALARSYDVAAITASPLARRVFVLPSRP